MSSRSVSLSLALGRSDKRTSAHAHPILLAQRTCEGEPFGVLHSAQLGAVASSLAPLSLLVRAPLRSATGSPTRSALRLKNGASILSADFVSVYALPLVAPLRVSLYCIFFLSIVDHSALRARFRSLFGRGRLLSR